MGQEEQMKTDEETMNTSQDETTQEVEVEEEEEEEGCGFCKFMRAGPCGDVFTGWEECIETGRKGGADYVESCLNETAALKLCMEKNPDYYGPLLAMEEEEEEERKKQRADDDETRSGTGDDESVAVKGEQEHVAG